MTRVMLFFAFGVVAVAAESSRSCDASDDADCSVSLLQQEHFFMKEDVQVAVSANGMAREQARTKLRIEQDLSKLDSRHYRAWNPSEDCAENADKAFDHFVETSDLVKEMTQYEIDHYRVYFDEHVEATCKQDDAVSEHWEQVIQDAFEAESPICTQQQAESMNAAHNSSFTVACGNYTAKRDAESRLGRDNSDEMMNAALLEAERTRRHRTASELDTADIPADFESGENWPACASVIRRIHNQGTCGSCWAFAGTSVMDSLICIKTNGAFQQQLSRTVTTSCASSGDGCSGGWEWWVMKHMKSNGVPTGASGCIPYFAHGEGTDHFTDSQNEPSCPTECLPHYSRSFAADSFTTPGAANHELVMRPNSGQWAANQVTALKRGMMTTGPVAYGIYASSAFQSYSGGVFDQCSTNSANHAVVTIGWSQEGGSDSWLSLNSWGSHWGENGMYKVRTCIITDYTIPGDLSESDIAGFPLEPAEPTPAPVSGPTPSPTPAPPTPAPTTPPPTPRPDFSVEGSGCSVDADGCVTTSGFPSNYGNRQSCTIKNFPKINVVDFNTERNWDKLTVNGQDYSGSEGPHHVTPNGDIKWNADYSVANTGWKLCPVGPLPTVAPTARPTSAPTSSPTNYPTNLPSSYPTSYPTNYPSSSPSSFPTSYPSSSPSSFPTSYPTSSPSSEDRDPEPAPEPEPPSNASQFIGDYVDELGNVHRIHVADEGPSTPEPTDAPTSAPTSASPTSAPTSYPTSSPTSFPTGSPTGPDVDPFDDSTPTSSPTGPDGNPAPPSDAAQYVGDFEDDTGAVHHIHVTQE